MAPGNCPKSRGVATQETNAKAALSTTEKHAQDLEFANNRQVPGDSDDEMLGTLGAKRGKESDDAEDSEEGPVQNLRNEVQHMFDHMLNQMTDMAATLSQLQAGQFAPTQVAPASPAVEPPTQAASQAALARAQVAQAEAIQAAQAVADEAAHAAAAKVRQRAGAESGRTAPRARSAPRGRQVSRERSPRTLGNEF